MLDYNLIAAAGKRDETFSGTFLANDICVIARWHVLSETLGSLFRAGPKDKTCEHNASVRHNLYWVAPW